MAWLHILADNSIIETARERQAITLMDVNHTPKVTHPLARRIFCAILEWRSREQV